MELLTENIKIKRGLIYLKYCFLIFFVFVMGFIFLRFPENTAKGILYGLNICFEKLIPTLFPFLVLSSFVIGTDITGKISKPLRRIAKFLFAQSEQAVCVFLLSMTGGYPIGPRMIKTLFEKGEISQDEGQRMLLFCMGPGPAFVISTVGCFMLNSHRIGTLIYASIVISSLIIGILSRFIKSENYNYCDKILQPEKEKGLSQILVESVSSSANSMLSICAWVILFSCFVEIIKISFTNESVRLFVCALAEVTTGCETLSKSVPVAAIAGIIAFGGFSTHFQVMSSVIHLGLKYKYFLTARILNCALSTVICQMLIDALPQSLETVSVGNKPHFTDNSASVSVTVALFIMSLLIVLGDNYIIKIRKHDKH